MKEQLELIKAQAIAALDAADTPAALEELRVRYLGKKGELTAVLKMMGKLSAEERPVMGKTMLRPLVQQKRACLSSHFQPLKQARNLLFQFALLVLALVC